MVRTKNDNDIMTDEEEPRPLSRYEKRHGLTEEMRSIKGARRTRKYRWEHERYDNATMTWAEKEEEADE